MNTNMNKMDGKKIERIWWPDNEDEQARRISAKDDLELFLSATYHGDHDELWVIELSKGKEIARHNVKYIETIIWAPM